MDIRNSFHFFAVLAFLGLFCHAEPQKEPLISKPQAVVVAKEDPSTSEIVEITMLDPNFPRAELEKLVDRIGENLGCKPTGFKSYVQKTGPGAKDQFIKARIGTTNLIEPTKDTVNLGAIAKAFAGIRAPHTIRAIRVVLDGRPATPGTIALFANEGIVVDGQILEDPKGLDYLITLRVQDPAKITIPLKNEPKTAPKPREPEPKNGPNLILILTVLASISAGALVYFLIASRNGTASKR